MGSEKRGNVYGSAAAKASPGPGSYAQRSFVGEGPKIEIKSRVGKSSSISAAMGPGPGTYQPNLSAIVEKTPAVGLGHGERSGPKNRSAMAVPGPGAYYSATDKREGPKFGFGSGKRGEAKPQQTPGPGNYAIPTTIGSFPGHDVSKHI